MKQSLRSLIGNGGKIKKTYKVARAVSKEEQDRYLVDTRQIFTNKFLRTK